MSTTFKVAHLREQGQDMVIVLVSSSFGRRSSDEQAEIAAELQACATSAGLRGEVVPVWDGGGGRLAFLAPREWHPFFQSISLQDVAASINGNLTCG